MVSTTQVLAAVGALVVAQTTYSLLSLVSVYFGPSRVTRYLHSSKSYALITGATDGIGKAVALNLYKKGFNLILHGRNEEKLKRVREEIKSTGPEKDIRLWVANADDPGVDFEATVAQWEGLEITLVIHNVGGASMHEFTLDGTPASELLAENHRNALFPFLLTRAILPSLRRLSGPVQLVFVGSFSHMLPIPRVIPYGATKAFLRQFSAALSADELFRAKRTPNVSTLYMNIGSVASATHLVPTSTLVPDAETFSKHFVHCIGCGRPDIVPYWPHALQTILLGLLPDSVLRDEMLKFMEMELSLGKK